MAIDRVSTSRWTTSNGIYGAHYPVSAMRNVPPISCRPDGADIGCSRPWPRMNPELLSPRVPQSWINLSPRVEPASAATASTPRVTTPREKVVTLLEDGRFRTFFPSSQRDAARGYSNLLSEVLGPSDPLKSRPSGPNDAWWSLHRASDNYGPWDGRPSRHGDLGGVATRREAGAAALLSARGESKRMAAAPVVSAAPAIVDEN